MYICRIVVGKYIGVSTILNGHEGGGFLTFSGCNLVCLIFFWLHLQCVMVPLICERM